MSQVIVTFKGNNPLIAGYQLKMTDAAGTVTDMGIHTAAEFPLTFTGPTAPGSYTFSCQAVDSSNSATSDPAVTDVVTIAAPVDNIPQTITVKL
jgi:hypothetical protein